MEIPKEMPTVTCESFRNQGQISTVPACSMVYPTRATSTPAIDRITMCGSMAMNRDFATRFAALGFDKSSNAKPCHIGIECAVVG